MANPRIGYIRQELAKMLNRYNLIRDCLIGSEAVKRKDALYLPRPNASDVSKENKVRYDAYKARAVFYNFTSRTLSGLVGQVFARVPVSEIPDSMDLIELDASGDGVTLEQSAQATLAYSLSYARSGLMVDCPAMPDGQNPTVADMKSGKFRPNIIKFDPFSIINWRHRMEGGVKVLTMVNIAEEWPFFDDGFEIKTACQFRVLWLNAQNEYTVTIYREAKPDKAWVTGQDIPKGDNHRIAEEYIVRGSDGQPLDRILFKFVGVRNNDGSVDNPTLIDLAELNMAHYRNSADYEDACYQMGQPTYWFSGLTSEWIKDVMKGQVRLGAHGGVLLPEGGSAGMMQPLPNIMVKEAMDAKEKQAVALGAKLVEQSTTQRTATEVRQDDASETSILAAAAKNVSQAYEWALNECAMFMGITPAKPIVYQLNSDFQMMQLSAADRAQLIKEWQAGSITFSEMRAVMRRSGVATMDDDEAQAAIADEQAAEMERAAKQLQMETIASTPPGGNNEAA